MRSLVTLLETQVERLVEAYFGYCVFGIVKVIVQQRTTEMERSWVNAFSLKSGIVPCRLRATEVDELLEVPVAYHRKLGNTSSGVDATFYSNVDYGNYWLLKVLSVLSIGTV